MTYQGISTAEIGQDRPSDRGGAVIVLDTDPGVRWALEKGLKRSGYDVRTASTSGEALRILYAEPVRAVIMEILPEADLTPDVLTTVLESPPKPKVICVSMESDPKAIIECVRRGCGGFRDQTLQPERCPRRASPSPGQPVGTAVLAPPRFKPGRHGNVVSDRRQSRAPGITHPHPSGRTYRSQLPHPG
ncbi:MAG: response regulator [Candidatus Hydrogenedentales bacterium]